MAQVKLDTLHIVDKEFTCTPDALWTRDFGELLEVAIVPIDLKYLEIRYDLIWDSLVKPVNTDVTPYCTELTGITAEMVKQDGKPAGEVMQTIEKRFGHVSAWGSWGDSDRKVLIRTCESLGVKPPLGNHLNLKYEYSLFRGRRREIGFKKALAAEGMTFEGEPHRAKADALNLALMWVKILRQIRSLA